MSKLTDKQIEETFAKIRADFVGRGNEYGLEILDGCENQWAETGQLSDGQLDWLERQLNGNWRQASKRRSLEAVQGGTTRERGCSSHSTEATGHAGDAPLDALIRERLGAQGEVVVDIARLDVLDAAVGELREAVKAIRSS